MISSVLRESLGCSLARPTRSWTESTLACSIVPGIQSGSYEHSGAPKASSKEKKE